jgi:PadR family transcriptional regulator PadR
MRRPLYVGRYKRVVYNSSTTFMSGDVKLTHTAALVLTMIRAGCRYGFDIMEATGLPSGTVYPALRRLEENELVQSKWEKEAKALAEQRPARKYYRLTALGEQAQIKAMERYPLLRQVAMPAKTRHARESA